MNNVQGRIPPGVPLLIIAINDQATMGLLQAVRAAGRVDQAIAVGNGADEAEAPATDPNLAGDFVRNTNTRGVKSSGCVASATPVA
ncbi:hypothetical protein [Rhizobium leguminosarum]|uniref:hypothetical protein n=1 Tax=Rhizobium leguminosarum TaxID=384 RepID=UPI001DAA0EAC|nr:hypothetical protein [Rhizobium leguminosarum]MBP2449236.1 hypothetical protein [Rhizobium leguminosarum]